MKVAKFGGTSLASAEQIKKICAIITEDPQRRLVVVSAPGKRSADDTKVTDLLIEAARVRLTGQDGTTEIERVINRYRDIAQALNLPGDSLAPIREDFLHRLHLDNRDEGLYVDTMKAGGEDNSARLVASYLRSMGIEAHYADPGESGMILSDEPGNARVLKQSYGKLRALREQSGITVFPGFFGYSESGQVVTFPRGGSDITGAILAA
ncbi:MAG: aspartate kinase, partial [Candidatus Latescibacterota bacterium]|nr:aspartate kinase [Candidatus Latescibacterota bacterium]